MEKQNQLTALGWHTLTKAFRTGLGPNDNPPQPESVSPKKLTGQTGHDSLDNLQTERKILIGLLCF